MNPAEGRHRWAGRCWLQGSILVGANGRSPLQEALYFPPPKFHLDATVQPAFAWESD
jgi:hypothetical protein